MQNFNQESTKAGKENTSKITKTGEVSARNKIISLGLHLNMDHEEVDEMLSLANMEKLYAKNPFELAIIYILEDAVLNNMVCTNGSDKLCQYARSVLQQLDIPEIEEFLSEL